MRRRGGARRKIRVPFAPPMQKLWSFWFSLAPHRKKMAVAAGLLALALAAAAVFWRPSPKSGNPLLTTPTLALEALQAKTLYFNGAAQPWLLKQRPDLLAEEDHSDNSERTRSFSQAVLNPKLFRQLDRRYRFDALLLTGDPSQYQPLLEHLLTMKDWTLRYVDSTSLVFRRGTGKAWSLADLDPVRARFANAPPGDRAIFLAQTGAKLVAAQQLEAAKQLLDEALGLDDRLPDAWAGLATYHTARGDWRDALNDVNRALSLDGDFLPALSAKTLLLYGSKQYSAAYELSSKLVSKLPDDPNILFYHAKIAHEAGAYKAEIEALLTLIARAEAEDRPVSGYQIYLGQAYAKVGQASRSIDQFMLALDDPDLTDEERSLIMDNIMRIKKKAAQ
jgi:tetratricopeptide (TPR) repeat protein